MVRLTLTLVLAVGGTGVVSSHAPAQDKDTKGRAEKILAALKRCGDTCHTATTGTLAESELVLDMIQKGEGDLSDKFPLAAKTLAEKNPKGSLSIDFAPPEAFTLKHLHKALGQPDRVVKVERPGRIDVTWQWYDWCAFGVTEDGQIVALAADLKKVKTKVTKP